MMISSRAVNDSKTGKVVAAVRLSQLDRLRCRRAPNPRTLLRETAMQLERLRWVIFVQVLATSRSVSSESGRLAVRSRCVSFGRRMSADLSSVSRILLQA